MLENYVALSITNILAMLLLAFVVGRNNLLDRKMKRFFSTAIFCTILVILAEIGTSVFGQPVASFSLPNMFFNVLGFSLSPFITISLATVYKGNIIKNLIMDCQSYTKYRPNETTGGIFVSWRRK
ncbi:hypothetical protein, partial [Gallintestinimicrobium sp.]|uniref:hypothetical protein n=1 Tax=Gallintestinimicrobium sp. TaxID=2981655 RepID=UPI003AB53D05